MEKRQRACCVAVIFSPLYILFGRWCRHPVAFRSYEVIKTNKKINNKNKCAWAIKVTEQSNCAAKQVSDEKEKKRNIFSLHECKIHTHTPIQAQAAKNRNKNVKLKKRRRHCTSSNNRVRAQDLFAWSAFHFSSFFFLPDNVLKRHTWRCMREQWATQNIASSGTDQSISIRPRFTWNKSTESAAKLCSRFYYSNRYILFVIAFFLPPLFIILNCGRRRRRRRMHHILARRLIK